MNKPLRVLLIEDSERDAALLQLYLRRGGYQAAIDRVENAADMKARLESAEWDVIISDMKLPRFSARAALDVLHESGLELPFIVVSGGGDEAAVQAILNAGATQYLLKDQMAQVVAAIDQAMLRS